MPQEEQAHISVGHGQPLVSPLPTGPPMPAFPSVSLGRCRIDTVQGDTQPKAVSTELSYVQRGDGAL